MKIVMFSLEEDHIDKSHGYVQAPMERGAAEHCRFEIIKPNDNL